MAFLVRTRLAVFLALTLACCGLLGAGRAQAAPHTVTALGTGAAANQLVQFTLTDPSAPLTPIPVSGLTAGDTLVGIDYRPLDGVLYGVAVNGTAVRVYTIAPTTGVATLTGGVTVNGVAGATAFGVDFNPVSDRIRVVNNLLSDGAGANVNNFRLRPDGTIAGVDTDLNFTGLPGGNSSAPATAVAHDRSLPGATATTAFALAAGGDRLVRIGGVDGNPSSNAGMLGDVGPFGAGVDTTINAGLDVDGETGVAYALLDVLGVARVYSVDLATGAVLPTALENRIGDGMTDFASLALPPRPALSLGAGAISVAEGDTATVTVNRSGPLGQAATVDYATDLTPATTATGPDFSSIAGTLAFPPGVGSQSFSIATTEDSAVEPGETLQVRLHGATDATLSPDPLLTTLTIVDDDVGERPPGAVAPKCRIVVRKQRIDRSLAATVRCDAAASARLRLRAGKRALSSAKVVLRKAGKRRASFALSRKEVRLLKRRAKGRKRASLQIRGSFAGAGGTTRAARPFKLG